MPDTAIRARGLTKRYGTKTVLDGLDLDVHHGEVLALLGPNGAGKTTTVEILEGFRAADRGEVSVLGADPAQGDRRWRARIGVVAQHTNDGGNLTVHEYLSHLRRAYPDPRSADEVIEKVGLTAQRRTRIGRLSGGQRRRVDVALAIVGRPDLLFLDEPTTGFDPESRLQLWDLVRELTGTGVTMLLTSHDLDEVEALANRVCVLVGGKVAASGTPRELGGRGGDIATVTWTDEGQQRSRRTDRPNEVVAQLLAERGDRVSGLEITRPTLEGAYLDLITTPEGAEHVHH